MKYLKIFEEFGEKLYRLMSDEELENLGIETHAIAMDISKNPNFKEFTNKEINRIQRVRYIKVSNDNRELYFTKSSGHIEYVEILTLGDEWYIIEVMTDTHDLNLYYKCDTIDGIIQYLKDEDLIPKRIPGTPIPRLPE